MLIEDIHSIEDVAALLNSGEKIELGEKGKSMIEKANAYILNKVKNDFVIYGINTGFGSLCDTIVPKDELGNLQYNLLRSHACGTGDLVPVQIVKLMLLLKVKSLSYGYSGVQLKTVQRLMDFYNNDVLPIVYQQGSLGASGDLAPLSHLCLPLIGEGEVWFENKTIQASELLEKKGWEKIELGPKEGLALINGTQFMSAYGIWAQIQSLNIIDKANKIAACSIDAFDARQEPFWPHTHVIRNQAGQQKAAEQILNLLKGSAINESPKTQVQDPYSFRCIPQVHGASIDALNHVGRIMNDELNAVTDNPNIFPDDDLVISGGNFHGQTLALSMDFAAIALSEVANISERRIYKLIAGERGLPPFLASNAGLESGFMIAQYTAAGIVSQNKQLCTPASVDSIVSSNGQEDHVSMGANAATKLYKVVENVQQVLAIELLTAIRAMKFRRPLKSSAVLEAFMSGFENEIKVPAGDAYLSPVLRQAKKVLFN